MDQRRASGASFADSESSLLDISRDPSDDVDDDAVAAAEDDSEDNENATSGTGPGSKQEGWSFEAEDDLDVDLLLKSTAENATSLAADEVDQKGDEDEKTCLDEVFKFDSELAAVRRRGKQRRGSEDSSEKLVAVSSAKESAVKETDGWNDLDDAFSVDDMVEDDAGEKASLNVKLGSSSSLDQQGLATSESENETELRQRKGVGGVSSTTGVTTATSEGETSSLGNSPNVRKTSKKSKKSKKKRF